MNIIYNAGICIFCRLHRYVVYSGHCAHMLRTYYAHIAHTLCHWVVVISSSCINSALQQWLGESENAQSTNSHAWQHKQVFMLLSCIHDLSICWLTQITYVCVCVQEWLADEARVTDCVSKEKYSIKYLNAIVGMSVMRHKWKAITADNCVFSTETIFWDHDRVPIQSELRSTIASWLQVPVSWQHVRVLICLQQSSNKSDDAAEELM